MRKKAVKILFMLSVGMMLTSCSPYKNINATTAPVTTTPEPVTTTTAAVTTTTAAVTTTTAPVTTTSALVTTTATSVTTTATPVTTTAATITTTAAPVTTTTPATTADTDAAYIKTLFDGKKSDVWVSGKGTVTRILKDDTEGDKHQRFILKLSTGQTLLFAHNIDIAPRIDDIAVGDTISFYGEYIYTEEGGTLHWTHHDPDGSSDGGWLRKGTETYK